MGDFGPVFAVPVFASDLSDLRAVRQSLHGPLGAAVRVALISSGCVCLTTVAHSQACQQC